MIISCLISTCKNQRFLPKKEAKHHQNQFFSNNILTWQNDFVHSYQYTMQMYCIFQFNIYFDQYMTSFNFSKIYWKSRYMKQC